MTWERDRQVTRGNDRAKFTGDLQTDVQLSRYRLLASKIMKRKQPLNPLYSLCLLVTEDTPAQTHAILAVMVIAGVAIAAIFLYVHFMNKQRDVAIEKAVDAYRLTQRDAESVEQKAFGL